MKKRPTPFYNIPMSKLRKAIDRNICETTVRGQKKYLVCVTLPNKKRKKKYFNFKNEAKIWLADYRKSVGADLSDFAALSQNQLADIRLALKKLPQGYSLTQCVDIVSTKYIATRTLYECLKDFLTLKADKGITEDYLEKITTRINKLRYFKSFDEISAESIIKLINDIRIIKKKGEEQKVLSQKTRKHYFSVFKEFFDWCKTRGYILNSPFDQIHSNDLPKNNETNPDVPTIENVIKFFEHAQKVQPQFVGILALVAFGGIRKEEATRLIIEDFDFRNKRITILREKSKTRQNWLQEDMPDNVWEWLEAYPPTDEWIKFQDDNLYEKLNKANLIPYNGLRHAFATYHLSLYRNAPKTSILLRHRSPNMLWQRYLGSLVSSDVAKAYFEILPTQNIQGKE